MESVTAANFLSEFLLINSPSTDKYRRISQMNTAGMCLQVSSISSKDNLGLISKSNSAS